MSKIKYGRWQKIVAANKKDSVAVEFPIKDGVVQIEVTPRISLTEQMALVNDVVSSCSPLPSTYEYDENTPTSTVDAHRKAALEYEEAVFRASVLQYYTNLDFSDERATLDEIWALAGDDNIYCKITGVICDDLYLLHDNCDTKLKKKMGAREELAGRILNLLDRIESVIPRKAAEEFFGVLEQADRLGLNNGDLLRVIGRDDADG